MTVYVLSEVDGSYSDVLGVFDSPNVNMEVLQSYYGQDAKELSHTQVEDSGIEWRKTVAYGGHITKLLMCSYEMNKIC